MTAQLLSPAAKKKGAITGEFAQLLNFAERWRGLLGQRHLDTLRKAALKKLEFQPPPLKRSSPYSALRLTRLVEQADLCQFAPHLEDQPIEPSSFKTPADLPSAHHLLVMVEGCFAPELSKLTDLPKEIEILDLATAIAAFPAHLMRQCVESETEFFSLMNASLVDRGVVIVLSNDCRLDRPLILMNVNRSSNSAVSFSQVHVIAGSNSALHLVAAGQSHLGWQHIAFNFTLDEKAQINFDQQIKTDESSYYFESIRADLKEKAHFHAANFSTGSFCTWRDIIAKLSKEMSSADIACVSALKKRRRFIASAKVMHLAPQARSDQWIRSALDDQARSFFCGKIFVAEGASQTESYQLNNNLLLSDEAIADSQPNLEILHDDVKASHGSTTGQIKEDDLFYLQSRGIPKAMGRALLIRGFVDVGIEKIKSSDLRNSSKEALAQIF